MAFSKDRVKLNQTLKKGIQKLHYEHDMSYADIGRKVGYPDGSMVRKITAHDPDDPDSLPPVLPDAVKLMKLSVLLSEHGLDETADLFSAPSKLCAPALEGHTGDWAPDRDVSREVAGVANGNGTVHAALERGDTDLAKRRWRVGLRWWQCVWQEILAIEEKGLPGRFEASPIPGDGLPSQPSLAL